MMFRSRRKSNICASLSSADRNKNNYNIDNKLDARGVKTTVDFPLDCPLGLYISRLAADLPARADGVPGLRGIHITGVCIYMCVC